MARARTSAPTLTPLPDDGAPNELGLMLRHYREQAGKTIPELAAETGVDRGYIYRLEMQPHDWLNRPLESAPVKQPSRDLIIRLAFALQLTADQADELLLAAGYAPLYALGRLDKHISSSR